MKINRKILLLFIIYIIGAVVFSGYKVVKGGDTYFNYKSVVNKAKQQLNKDKDKGQNTSETSINEKDKSNAAAAEASQPTANTATSQTTDNNAAAQKDEDYANVKFTRVLGENFKGDDVKKLQFLLKKNKYYNGDITGTFDAATKQALIKFQKDNKLPADGTLGNVSWTKLEQQ